MTPDDIETTLLDSYARVLNYVRQKTNEDDAADLTQTIFLRAFDAMRRGHGSTEHLTGWLWKIVNHVVIDYYRARGREPQWLDLDACWDGDDENSLAVELVADGEPTPHEIVEQRLTVERVQRAIDRLPSVKQTDALQMRLLGYDNTEIAEVMQMRVESVRQCHTRAYAGLRVMLGDAA